MNDLTEIKTEEDKVIDSEEVMEDSASIENENLDSNESASNIDVEEDKDVKIAELTERLLRNQAEFDNFRRRTQKEKEELSGFTKGIVFGNFLPVVDNFERALLAPDGPAFRQGMEMIQQQLLKAMEAQGLSKIKTQGEIFDPQYHEAVMREPSEDQPEGTILEELQAGYQLGNQILRPAMVKISG